MPRHAELCRALEACDPRDVWWVLEMNSGGPLYFLPTREWMRALGRWLDDTRAHTLLEVGAGDGFLARCIREIRPRLEVHATDDGSWSAPHARMRPAEQRLYRAVPVPGLALGANVRRMSAITAVRRFRPDLVLVSWAPPGSLLQRLLATPCKHVLDIGAEGDVCGSGPALWSRAEAFLDGALERLALCRLDTRPSRERHTRITLYRGGASKASAVSRRA